MKSTTRILTSAILAACFLTNVAASPAISEDVGATSNDEQPYAPLDRPGSPLSAPESKLSQSVRCTSNIVSSEHTPVLLVPGTTWTPGDNFSWNYEHDFDQQKRPYCTVNLPDRGMGDIQKSAEYVVHAIRTMHAATGKNIQVVGHSQGGMIPRWALRFWPDTRAIVDDVIAIAGSNHGALLGNALCPPAVGCAPSIWQQNLGSKFNAALNSKAETFPGISYTNIYTMTDEDVQPALNDRGSTSLHGGGGAITNVSVQSICPGHVTDHLLIGTADPVAHSLVMDGLNHDGPASPERIDRATCGQLFQPGVNPASFTTDFARFTGALATTLATYPHIPAEPPLAPYVKDTSG